jgi:hypothetical protein
MSNMSNAVTEAVETGSGHLSERKPSVYEAWTAVMNEVQGLGKHQRTDARAGNFNFRGIDDVMNAVGPALRRHGVSVIPSVLDHKSRDFTTKSGTVMHEVHVLVQFTVYGPDGDSFHGGAPGESADAGDKATPKAMSVAFRTFLLQALCLPTDEPDPDMTLTDRAPVDTKAQDAATVATGLLKPDVTAESVARVKAWSVEKGIMDEQVADDEGNGMPLWKLFDRIEAHFGAVDEEAEQRVRDSLGGTEVREENKEEQA